MIQATGIYLKNSQITRVDLSIVLAPTGQEQTQNVIFNHFNYFCESAVLSSLVQIMKFQLHFNSYKLQN